MVDFDTQLYKNEMTGKPIDKRADVMYGGHDPDLDAEQRQDLGTELCVDVSHSELMAMTQMAADILEYGDKAGAEAFIQETEALIQETEEYLRRIKQAEKALEGQHPPFSEVIKVWADDEFEMRQHDDSSVDLAKAKIYEDLQSEMFEDYREAMENGNTKAIAEWDVVSNIIDQHIHEHTLRDMQHIVRKHFALAA